MGEGLAGSYIQLEAVDKHWGRRRAQIQTAYLFGGARGKYAHRYDPDWEAEIISASRERVPDLQARGFNVFVKERGSVMGCYFHQQWERHLVGDRRVRQA